MGHIKTLKIKQLGPNTKFDRVPSIQHTLGLVVSGLQQADVQAPLLRGQGSRVLAQAGRWALAGWEGCRVVGAFCSM